MINHFKKNYIIYLLILLIVIVILAIKFVPRTKKVLLDTSMFNVIDTKEALDLFSLEDNKAKLLMIGRNDCSACISFEPILKIAIANYHFNVNYLELSLIDNSDKKDELLRKLDYEYTLDGNTDNFSSFLGVTPMIIVIKNGRMVYGTIGTLNQEELKSIIDKYEIN